MSEGIFMVTAREILLTLSFKYKGDWMKVYEAIKKKEPIKDEEKKEAIDKTKANFVTLVDPDYPEFLKTISQPPFLFYYYGDKSLLLEKYRLTVVGTRHPSLYQTEKVYSLLAEAEKRLNNKIVVVSGMAIGVDASGMRAALACGGKYIGILGSGIDNPYPTANEDLYKLAKQGKGLIISEYPLAEEAKPQNFLFRNRLLAAFSDVLMVGGGKNKSGTSVSVKYALDFNKEVLALPCNVTGDDLTNSLIQDGARSVLGVDDIISALKEKADLSR